MINTFKFSIFLVKNTLPKRFKKKNRLENYVGFIVDADERFNSIANSIISENNSPGLVLYNLTGFFQCYINREDGSFCIDPGDYRDPDIYIKKAKYEYIKYLSDSTDISPILSGIEKFCVDEKNYKKINISLDINNEGYECFASKDGDSIYRISCVTTGSGVIPKFRNKRERNIAKAYNLLYKNLFK